MKNLLTLLIIFLFAVSAFCQENEKMDSSKIIKARFIPLVAGSNAIYAGSMIWLNTAWYKENSSNQFHLFNDNGQWMQMDKLGHTFTAFHISQFAIKSLQWSGVDKKKSILFGGIAGLFYLTPIEIMDGYSKEYGASWGDMAANTAGSALVLSQYLLWNEPRIQMKFSFHRTPFANRRPNTLGGNLPEQVLKDYNGQTYWLSFNIKSFTSHLKVVPEWLNLSIGYGASDMQYGSTSESLLSGFNPHRQYYISFDVDLEQVKTKKKWVKVLAYPLKIVKIPFPALELSRKGFRFHPLYF